MVRGLTIFAIAGAIALATMLPGCGQPRSGNDRDVEAEAMTEAGRADSEPHGTDQHVAYEVSGMKKTASGATWMGWPDKVDESLAGVHSSVRSTWNYEDDLVSITFDGKALEPVTLRRLIESLGYGVKQVEATAEANEPATTETVDVTETAPAKLREAFARAASRDCLILVAFRATWCAPCLELEKTTLSAAGVKKLLKHTELVHVDLDEHPDLGKLWGVTSVPDIFFVAPDGRVLDRLRRYEEVEPFKERLGAAIRRLASRESR